MDELTATQQARLERLLSGDGLVRRQSLIDRLSGSPAGGVAIVSAPAGSGKTVLVRSWLDSEDLWSSTAWVSVESGERDAQRFWLSVIDALADTAGGEGDIERSGPTPEFRGEAAIERLLADVDALQEPVVLVIDDLHELRSRQALEWVQRFLERLPSRMRLVLTCREEPDLDLHDLRLSGALTEIRGEDLGFTKAESQELLRVSGIELSEESLGLLHDRTEGWVAGLRLAAISLREHPDRERFVRDFTGSERTVAGYLMAEVLERQPPEVRELLLKTGILDRVNGALADLLTDATGSERILQELEEANAFVTSLDPERSWFRYHHLFADMLRLELRRTDPVSIPSLHRTAASWYEEHGHPVEAIRHAQSGEDWAHAARMLADSYIGLILDGRIGAVRALVGGFPADAPARDAELAVALAGVRLFEGRPEDTVDYLELADRLAAEVPEERRWRFDLRKASTKLWLARRRVDLSTTLEAMRSVEEALAAQPPAELSRGADHRATALMNLGIAELWSARIPEARLHLEEALDMARRIERPYLEVGCLAHMALAAPLGGAAVTEGIELADEAIAAADARGWGEDFIVAPALVVAGVELMWLGHFDDAQRRFERAERALGRQGDPMPLLVLRWAWGMLRFARGDYPGALAAFSEAQETGALLGEGTHAIDPTDMIIHTQVRLGEAEVAREALAGLSEGEREHALVRIATAEVHLADGNPEQALEVLAPVIEGSSRAVHSLSSLIDAQLYCALAHDQLGDRRASEDALERALELAEPEGIVLAFTLAPVRELLERHPRHRTSHATLLTDILSVIAGSSLAGGPVAQPAEELSEAELRVIRYLPSNLKAPEIAAELYVSPNTVRTHLRHIYAKLDAHSRAEAVERARELGLIGPSRLR